MRNWIKFKMDKLKDNKYPRNRKTMNESLIICIKNTSLETQLCLETELSLKNANPVNLKFLRTFPWYNKVHK